MPAVRLLVGLAVSLRAGLLEQQKKGHARPPARHQRPLRHELARAQRELVERYRKLAPRDGWTAALVVAADDVETPCDDQHDQCASWAEGGECDANPGYMLRSCRSSCKSCAPCGSVDAQSLLVS